MAAGRPPIFDTADDLDAAIQDYFDNGIVLKKKVITNAITVEVPVPTISGLAYYIGFDSRQSFYDYETKPEFSYTIKRARLFIEREYEEQLQVGNTIGAIFALKNMGWRDKVETGFTDSDGKDVQPQIIFQPAPNCQPVVLDEPTPELVQRQQGKTD